jgi:hypothetical protein
LRAQEFDLPPAPSSATEQHGRAFSAENGPCFYNPYTWMMRGFLNQAAIGAELAALSRGWQAFDREMEGCVGRYGLTPYDFFGSWSYMIADGVRRPRGATQAEVRAAWKASYKAAAEGRTTMTVGDAPVPRIGNGYGSDDLSGQTLILRVRPDSKGAFTRDGVPIIERNRSWERIETAEGRRVWSYSELDRKPSLPTVSDRYRSSDRTSRSSVGADRRIRAQEGFSRATPRMTSPVRSPKAAPASPRPSSSAAKGRPAKTGVEN